MALKHNSKQVLDIIAGQKKRNAKQAYLSVHPDASPKTAEVNVAQLLAKPEAALYLQEHKREAEETIIDVMRNARAQTDSAPFQTLAGNLANSVVDRVDGKATIRTENVTTGVTLNIDLTSALAIQAEGQPN